MISIRLNLNFWVPVAAAVLMGSANLVYAGNPEGEREKPWVKALADRAPELRSRTNEVSQQSIDGSTLAETWERAKNNPDFISLVNQVDSNDQRLGNVEGRIVSIEQKVANE